MKRFLGSIRRGSNPPGERPSRGPSPSRPTDSPEVIVVKEMIAFCENGQINTPGDEYLHLPAIVEAAESGPAAAQAAARQLHKYLSKPTTHKGDRQYNAIMLLRILADNPGATFTRNIDSRFVASVKSILRDGRDMSVQQILRETLESLAQNKASDENLAELLAMWDREKKKYEKHHKISPVPAPQIYHNPSHDHFVRQQRNRGLPPPQELAGRITEANNSAKLLLQMVQSTSLDEVQQNELLREFAQRCQTASRSMQNYIGATDPAPDEDTMLTLIETNDKLAVSLSKYQRAVLNARKAHPVPQSRSGSQAPSQENNPPVSNETQNKPIPKNRFVPRLSMPRMPLRKKQPDQPDQPPAQPVHHVQAVPGPPAESKGGAANQPGDDVSPVGHTLFPQSSTNGETASTNPNKTTAPPTSFRYNSDDFQIENPFADKYSTTNDNMNNANHDGPQTVSDPGRTSNAPQIGDLHLGTGQNNMSNFQTYDAQAATPNPPPSVAGARRN